MKNLDYIEIWKSIEDSGMVQQILDKINKKLSQDRVSNYIPAKKIKNEFDFNLSNEPEDIETIRKNLILYIDQAINTQSPYFVNQLYGGAHPVAVISEWVNAFMNTSMATYEIAPLATIFEDEILKSLASLMKWSNYDGLMVPGGSYANMMSLHLSRFAKTLKLNWLGSF